MKQYIWQAYSRTRATLCAVRVEPLDDLDVAFACRIVHGNHRAALCAVRVEPLDDLEVTVVS